RPKHHLTDRRKRHRCQHNHHDRHSGSENRMFRHAEPPKTGLACLVLLLTPRRSGLRHPAVPGEFERVTSPSRRVSSSRNRKRTREVVPMTKVAVIYYSATGNVHALAEAVADGAAEAGAQVRLRRVAELAPAEAIDSNPAWRAHSVPTGATPLASTDDVRWANGFPFGGPPPFGRA